MQEDIDAVDARNSPQEWAIHFLLRHNQCRMALVGDAGEGGQSMRVMPAIALSCEVPVVAVLQEPVRSVASAGVSPRMSASGDSCAARFSRAFAAARHS